jgi:hypothetical protein
VTNTPRLEDPELFLKINPDEDNDVDNNYIDAR